MILFIALIIFFFSLLMMIRNCFVYAECIEMNKIVFNQKNYEHYLAIKHVVSYDKMMLHFWVWPIHKMWPEELQKLR